MTSIHTDQTILYNINVTLPFRAGWYNLSCINGAIFMRHQTTLITLLVGCALILSACAQSASVGIPTPDQASLAAQAAVMTSTAAVPVSTLAPVEQFPTETPIALVLTATPTPDIEPTVTPRPRPRPRPTAVSSCSRTITHIVKPGENLFRIALRYKTTVYAIARRNGIRDTRYIRSGQRLSIVTCARS